MQDFFFVPDLYTIFVPLTTPLNTGTLLSKWL